MKQLSFFISGTLFIIIFYSGCKDGFLEDITRKDKVTGNKKVVLYMADGVDSLNYLYDSILGCKSFVLSFGGNEVQEFRSKVYYLTPNCREDDFDSSILQYPFDWEMYMTFSMRTWSPDFKRKLLFIGLGTFDLQTEFSNLDSNKLKRFYHFQPFYGSWNISKLTKDELWLEREKYSKLYQLHLKETEEY